MRGGIRGRELEEAPDELDVRTSLVPSPVSGPREEANACGQSRISVQTGVLADCSAAAGWDAGDGALEGSALGVE